MSATRKPGWLIFRVLAALGDATPEEVEAATPEDFIDRLPKAEAEIEKIIAERFAKSLVPQPKFISIESLKDFIRAHYSHAECDAAVMLQKLGNLIGVDISLDAAVIITDKCS